MYKFKNNELAYIALFNQFISRLPVYTEDRGEFIFNTKSENVRDD